jgi:hypothetical protein
MYRINRITNKKDKEKKEVNWKEIWEQHKDRMVNSFFPQPRKAYGELTDGDTYYEIYFDEDYFLYWLNYVIFDHLGKNESWLKAKIGEMTDLRKKQQEENLKSQIKQLAKEKHTLMGENAPPLEQIEQTLLEALED